MLTQVRLKELLSYNPETGVFTWLAYPNAQYRSSARIGHPAGSITTRGYRCIGVAGRIYAEHRLAWLYMTGEWPKDQIDHRNGVKTDNHWANLRKATHSQNAMNKTTYKSNTSGHKGVSRFRDKWAANVSVQGHQKFLGYFTTVEGAAAAVAEARTKLHGDFARHK